MKRGWKIALISVGSLLGLIVVAVAVVLWLVFTPSQLTKIVNRVAATYVDAETHFESVDLTLFRTFPDAGLKVGKVYVLNPMEGAPTDTVAAIGSLTLGVDVKRFLKEKEVVVHQVLVDDVQASLFIDSTGKSNFDIFPSSEEEEEEKSAFSLDSLPQMELKKIALREISASLKDLQGGMEAGVERVNVGVWGTLMEGKVDARVSVDGKSVALRLADSLGVETLSACLQDVALGIDGAGSMDSLGGRLRLNVGGGAVALAGEQMVNEVLQQSKKDLLSLDASFGADMRKGEVQIENGALKIDRFGLHFAGSAVLPEEERPMGIDLSLNTDGAWQVQPLLDILPMQFVGFREGMELDAELSLQAEAKGTLTDSTFPKIDASVKLADGSFYMPRSLPYRVRKVEADVDAAIDLGEGRRSSATIHKLSARASDARLSLSGQIDDLLGDMAVGAKVRASLPLEDVLPFLPDSLALEASGKADVDLDLGFRMSQIEKQDFAGIRASGSVGLKELTVDYDSIGLRAPNLDIALSLPAHRFGGKMGEVSLRGKRVEASMGTTNAVLVEPEVSLGVNNILAEQIQASVDLKVGETEANIDSMMVSLEALSLSGEVRLDSLGSNVLSQYNPEADVQLRGAVLYMPELPDAVRLSELSLGYGKKGLDLRSVMVKLGHSDFNLYGTVENIEEWIDKKEMLRADLNFTSGYADVDQLMYLVSGIGTDADTLEQMRQEDEVPPEANPFIVPKDVDVTLHTHIKRSIAFGNDLNDVAGAVTVRDGVAVLDQIGFVCKAATMQLTAMYKSPRPSHLFASLDFHLLDIRVDELIDMIPTIDTLVPMLSAFNGNANFHLAAETYLNANYQPLMSSLKGAAAISGKNLTVLDNNSIAQIAKLMQLKSWKDKDNKITIDSLDVELTCLNKVIEVYPFLLNVGKYSLCASGMHSMDNQCGYHIELLKNPLLAKVGVDVKGTLSSPKISLGEVRYADYYRPEKQGVVEKQTLELKRQLKEALEAKVR